MTGGGAKKKYPGRVWGHALAYKFGDTRTDQGIGR